MEIVSPEIKLNPGIEVDGKTLTSAKVRLLTRAERRTIELLPLEEQEDRFFKSMVVQLGHLKAPQDRKKIDDALEDIYETDENRIYQARKELAEKQIGRPESEGEKETP